jgi:hypothetical protein
VCFKNEATADLTCWESPKRGRWRGHPCNTPYVSILTGSVAVNQSFQHAPYPNWKASFVTDGPRNTPGDAIQFAEELGATYDLA